MLKLKKALTVAEFDNVVIGNCYSKAGVLLGYSLTFGDFVLYVDEYVSQLVNLFGVSLSEGVFIADRRVTGKRTIVSEEYENKLLQDNADNTLLLTSLSLYLNGVSLSSITVNYDEWSNLKTKYKLLICYLLGSSNSIINLLTLYKSVSVKEKYELFQMLLSLVSIINLKLVFLSSTKENVEVFADIENNVVLSNENTIEDNGNNLADNTSDNSSHFYEKVENITVIEKHFGNFHISADEQFYENLKIVVENTPLYRGKTAWSKILVTLRDDERYSGTTSEYLSSSGYKLNTNNIQNWYKYSTDKILKTNKFKIVTDLINNEELKADIKYIDKEE